MRISDLNPFQIDSIREAVNIASGHAATALSKLTKRKIFMNPPEVFWGKSEDVFNAIIIDDYIGVGILQYFLGDLTGLTLLLISEREAKEILYFITSKHTEEIGEDEESALKEITNIVTGSYMTSLSEFLKLLTLPTVPYLKIDSARTILTSALLSIESYGEFVLSIKTTLFIENGPKISLNFFFLPDEPSISILTSKLEEMLK